MENGAELPSMARKVIASGPSNDRSLDLRGVALSKAAEQEMLTATRAGLQRLVRERNEAAASHRTASRQGKDRAELSLAELAHSEATGYRDLLEASDGPYYARFDVVESGKREQESYYLTTASSGADTTLSGGAFIMAFDSDMARAFRAQGIGVQAGDFRGEAMLRRRFVITDESQVESVEDSLNRYSGEWQVASGDPFLAQLLRRGGTRARTIVATLAEEQDKIVFAPPVPLMVIEGVPGSGKTQVGQLRVAALVSGRQFGGRSVATDDILILAPSRALLGYLERVLPVDMHVAGVRQEDLTSLLRTQIGKIRLAPGAVRPWRGSDEFGTLVERFAKSAEAHQIERAAQIAAESAEWQLNREQVLGAYVVATRVALSQQPAVFEKELLRRAEATLATFRDNDRAKFRRAVRKWMDEVFREEPLEAMYRSFLRAVGEPEALDHSDIAALAYLRHTLGGPPPVKARHVVLDEGQDVQPLAYRLLRNWFPDAQFVVLGDLAQARGELHRVERWTDLQEIGFAAPSVYRLDVNYRCAPPIVAVLNELGKKLNPPVPPMGDIERPAEPVLSVVVPDEESLASAIGFLLSQNPHETAAILYRTADGADDGFLRLLDPLLILGTQIERFAADEEYTGGVVVASRDEISGLEFDLVIIADADAATYDGSSKAAADLYTLASRAQNRLAFVICGAPATPLNGLRLAATAYERGGVEHPEGRWTGAGAFGTADLGWGFQLARHDSGRLWTSATPGISEDRYDDESGPDDAKVDWYDRSSQNDD